MGLNAVMGMSCLMTDFDLLEFNGTFSTNRLYRAFEKYVAVKKVKLMNI